jgi:valyl-tRNA synthetase
VSQQITVTTEASIDLKPLLESAIRSELHMLELSLDRTAQRLRAFEAQYEMTSEAFMQRFETGALAESLDYIEWAGKVKTYSLLQEQQQALRSVHLQ